MQLSEYCNMETFRARCQHGDVIVMETALFGRMRVGRCITSDAYLTALQQLDPTSLGCSADVLGYFDRVCSGRSACDVSVLSREMNAFRPCSAQLTVYLEASYSCVASRYWCGFTFSNFFLILLSFNTLQATAVLQE